MTHTAKEVQTRLIAYGFPLGQYGADGVFGLETLNAFNLWRRSQGKPPIVGIPHLSELASELFPEDAPKPKPRKENILDATIKDYFLNFISSKIVWVAAAAATALSTFLANKGFNLSPEMQATVSQVIIWGGTAIVAYLRTFKNAPRVVTKPPAIVTSK